MDFMPAEKKWEALSPEKRLAAKVHRRNRIGTYIKVIEELVNLGFDTDDETEVLFMSLEEKLVDSALILYQLLSKKKTNKICYNLSVIL